MSAPASRGPRGAAVVSDPIPAPRSVRFDAPWDWLAAGWRDIWRAPGVSLVYGVAVAAASWLLFLGLLQIEALALVLALAGGFLLLGPMLAVGLYQISRQLEAGLTVRFTDVFLPAQHSRGQLAFFGVLLLLFFSAWVRFASLLASIFLGGMSLPPLRDFVQTLLFTTEGLSLMIVGTALGAMLAVVVFAFSAFSVPMLIDKRTDVFTAARASVAAVVANPRPMGLWAALIVVMIGAGVATAFAGLVIAFPLIGHATWHAYRDVFGGGERS
ncbi:MAG TPA: DUF2189 domain-containing protein [Hyphomicrobiaceae bacterium]|mgnify:CR=1 FL=1|nr:DUF2189 domain-containing protein [Hyphomicrobiaceae bacterium]